MQFVIIKAEYYLNADPVVIVCQNPVGGLTYVNTSQTELGARVPAGGPWGDAEILAEATAKLPALFPGLTGITATLYEPPAAPAATAPVAAVPVAAPAAQTAPGA